MSDQTDQDDKTEEPTEKKLRDAAERGDLPRSREAPLFAALLAFLLVSSLMLRSGVASLAEVLAGLLEHPDQWVLNNGADAASLLLAVGKPMALFILPIAGTFMIAGLAISFAQHMPTFVLDRIAPKLSKISIVEGFGRLFSLRGLMEFGKTLLKLLAVCGVVFLLLQSEQRAVIDVLFMEPAVVPEFTLRIVIRLVAGVATAFVVVAAIDFFSSKSSWRKRMRMTRQEVKDEIKQSEGDPIFKAKRRSLALDRSRRRMISDIPRATVVITNPTHYSIALRYVRSEGGAPIVIAKGKDLIALKIREVATSCGILIVENKPLARSMYDHIEVSQAIPPEFYKAVAEIIHYVQTRGAARSKPRQHVVTS